MFETHRRAYHHKLLSSLSSLIMCSMSSSDSHHKHINKRFNSTSSDSFSLSMWLWVWQRSLQLKFHQKKVWGRQPLPMRWASFDVFLTFSDGYAKLEMKFNGKRPNFVMSAWMVTPIIYLNTTLDVISWRSCVVSCNMLFL